MTLEHSADVLLAVPPDEDGGRALLEPLRATDVSARRATIWADAPIDRFPVYLGFEGLAPYFVEGRVVGESQAREDHTPGQVVEFTTLLHGSELGVNTRS